MPCYHPLTGYRSKYVNPKTGKRPLVFNLNSGYADLPVTIPCGNCHGCRLEYSRQWAIRCVHEAQLFSNNCFITLTYDNEHLPADRSISKRELQTFFKRLRKKINKPIRYFACGEYGDISGRPHYHAIIFNYDFPDKQLHSKSKGGLLYKSPTLAKTWKKGFSTIGDCTYESAAYVARYVMKKRRGKPEEIEEHYKLVDEQTGEIHNIQPEFCLMSRGHPSAEDPRFKKGIGNYWLQKFKNDTDKDFITVNRQKQALPKYYDNILEAMGEDMEERKRKRLKALNKEETQADRLEVKKKVRIARTKILTRDV